MMKKKRNGQTEPLLEALRPLVMHMEELHHDP